MPRPARLRILLLLPALLVLAACQTTGNGRPTHMTSEELANLIRIGTAPVILDVLRDRNALYRELPAGLIENTYTIKIINQTNGPREFVLTADGLPGLDVGGEHERRRLRVALHDDEVVVEDRRTRRAPFVIRCVVGAHVQPPEILAPLQLAFDVVQVQTFRAEQCGDVPPVRMAGVGDDPFHNPFVVGPGRSGV